MLQTLLFLLYFFDDSFRVRYRVYKFCFSRKCKVFILVCYRVAQAFQSSSGRYFPVAQPFRNSKYRFRLIWYASKPSRGALCFFVRFHFSPDISSSLCFFAPIYSKPQESNLYTKDNNTFH